MNELLEHVLRIETELQAIKQLLDTKKPEEKPTLSPTVVPPFNESPPQAMGDMWGVAKQPIVSNRETELLGRLGIGELDFWINVPGRKKVYFTKSGDSIVMSKSAYKEEYPNDAPMVGRTQEEQSLFNKCTYWVVARYVKNEDGFKPSALFDCRGITLTMVAGQTAFSSPVTDGCHINAFDSFDKIMGLQRVEG